jgi:hypothetical protein
VDIRTKLVLTLVSVSLASMLVFGLITYRTVQGEFGTRTTAP